MVRYLAARGWRGAIAKELGVGLEATEALLVCSTEGDAVPLPQPAKAAASNVATNV